jgi:fumarate reductase flavoprotein subunit
MIYPFTTNGAIKTGDGMAMAYKAGVPLKDMEFVQYHPTGLPGTGILLTEGCRGEGGYLTNKDDYRYLQDYGLGPAKKEPVKKAMELGPRDRLSQAFYHEMQKGNTIQTRFGEAVNLDLRHLGEKLINERLPFVRDLARSYMGVDIVYDPCPVRPVVHYMMGGIHTNIETATPIEGLYAAGECACGTINGANRLGSNSLTELLVFGAKAGENAVKLIEGGVAEPDLAMAEKQAANSEARIKALFERTDGKERPAQIRKELRDMMEESAGIYRSAETLQAGVDKIAELRDRYKSVTINDKSSVFNTALSQALELDAMIEVSQALLHSALQRTESRGAHQRLDHEKRDDVNFLTHSMAHYNPNGEPRIDYLDVVITKSKPAERLYGAAGEAADKARKESEKAAATAAQ